MKILMALHAERSQVSPGSLVPGQYVIDVTDSDKVVRAVKSVHRERNYYVIKFKDGSSGNYDQSDRFEVIDDISQIPSVSDAPANASKPKKEYVVYAGDVEGKDARQLYWSAKEDRGRWGNEADAELFTEQEADRLCARRGGIHTWVKKRIRV